MSVFQQNLWTESRSVGIPLLQKFMYKHAEVYVQDAEVYVQTGN